MLRRKSACGESALLTAVGVQKQSGWGGSLLESMHEGSCRLHFILVFLHNEVRSRGCVLKILRSRRATSATSSSPPVT